MFEDVGLADALVETVEPVGGVVDLLVPGEAAIGVLEAVDDNAEDDAGELDGGAEAELAADETRGLGEGTSVDLTGATTDEAAEAIALEVAPLLPPVNENCPEKFDVSPSPLIWRA